MGELTSGIDRLAGMIRADARSEGFAAPVHHFFGEGVYCRVMQLKGGDLIVGKTHRFDHVVTVLAGEMAVANTAGDRDTYLPGSVFESPAGAQRAIFALTDCAMMTIHQNPTNTRDMAELEAYLIAPETDTEDEQ